MNLTILERFDLFKETFNVFGTFILKKSDDEIEYLVFENRIKKFAKNYNNFNYFCILNFHTIPHFIVTFLRNITSYILCY